MAKVAVRTSEQAEDGVYFAAAADPIHLALHRLAKGQTLALGPLANDCAVYVWQGEVAAGEVGLAAGSSAIIGRGCSLALTGVSESAAQVLCYSGSHTPASPGSGDLRLLPADRVPRLAAEPGGSGVSGGLHADSDWPGSSVWLHENHFPAMDLSSEQAALGIHSHSEDEIIFVIAGAMRLGNRLVGPGTAVAIAADTLYGFTAGPDGLSFVNFRAAMPGDIRFAHGASMSETGYWRERVGRPAYVMAAGAQTD